MNYGEQIGVVDEILKMHRALVVARKLTNRCLGIAVLNGQFSVREWAAGRPDGDGEALGPFEDASAATARLNTLAKVSQ